LTGGVYLLIMTFTFIKPTEALVRVPSHEHCHPIPLAHGPVGQVEACTCGAVRLSVGPLTLRFEAASFLALVDLLEQARERLLCGGARPLNPGQAA
jgi:hypothetical protein